MSLPLPMFCTEGQIPDTVPACLFLRTSVLRAFLSLRTQLLVEEQSPSFLMSCKLVIMWVKFNAFMTFPYQFHRRIDHSTESDPREHITTRIFGPDGRNLYAMHSGRDSNFVPTIMEASGGWVTRGRRAWWFASATCLSIWYVSIRMSFS